MRSRFFSPLAGRFMQVQAAISREKLAAKVGRTLDVLVDEVHGTKAIGRSAADAPEIDGVVRIANAMGVKPGDIVRVKITRSDEHDLQATLSPALSQGRGSKP